MPPLYVRRGDGRQTLVLHQQPEGCSSPAYAWLRLYGEAVFENNRAAKEMCMQNPIVKGQYGEAANPIFVVFYLKDARAVIADFSGDPPREYDL